MSCSPGKDHVLSSPLCVRFCLRFALTLAAQTLIHLTEGRCKRRVVGESRRPTAEVRNDHRLLFGEAIEAPPDTKAGSASWCQTGPEAMSPDLELGLGTEVPAAHVQGCASPL